MPKDKKITKEKTGGNKRDKPESSEGSRSNSPSPGVSPVRFPTAPGEVVAIPIEIPPEQMKKIMEGAEALQNMALAHEIAMDGSFKLQQHTPPENSIEKMVRENIKRAFWDMLTEELNSKPPKYSQALRLLQDVKQGLCNVVLPRHTKLLQNINEVLDTTVIKQQTDAGVLDFQAYSNYVLTVMSKVCAEARDEKIKELFECTNVVETFRGILELLDVMRLDLANASIQMARPNFMAHSIQYEKEKFNEYLKSREGQEDCFEDTKKWLHRHIGTGDRSIEQILNSAYLEFLRWDPNTPFPETMIFDRARLSDLSSRLTRLEGSATALVIAGGLAPALRGVSSYHSALHADIATLMKTVTSDEDMKEILPNISIQVIKQTVQNLQQHGLPELTSEQEQTFEGQILTVSNPDNSVRKVLYQRLIDYFRTCLEASRGPLGVSLPPGWGVWGGDIIPLAAGFCRLTIHNRSVYGEHYHKLITLLKNKIPCSSNAS